MGIIILLIFSLFSLPIDLQLGSRPIGMGGAFAGISDDSNAVYWNPAGLSGIKNPQVSFMYSRYLDFPDISVNFLSYAQRNLGFSWVDLSTTLKEGESGIERDMGESEFIFAYGVEVNKKLNLGASLKRLLINSSKGGGAGIGFDMGTIYRIKKFSFAIVYRNLASDVKNENIPSSLRFGIACKTGNLKIAMDIDSKKDIEGKEGDNWRFHLGGEYKMAKGLFLRTGFDRNRLTFGMGLAIRDFQFDFSFWGDNVLGDLYRLSLGYNFISRKVKTGKKKQTLREKLFKEGEKYFKEKRLRLARKRFQKILKYYPRDEESIFYLKKIYWGEADKYFRKRNYKKALKIYKEILKIDPEHTDSKNRIKKIKNLKRRKKKKK